MSLATTGATAPTFSIPLWLDLLAMFVGSFSGLIVAIRHRYDFVGATVLALLAGFGGALMRDGLFLANRPSGLFTCEWYVLTGVGVVLFTPLLIRWKDKLTHPLDFMDTLALGLYGMIGTQKAFVAGMALGPSILVGVVNAVGGGLLRDLVCNETPSIFRPGSFYAAAVIAGSSFCVLALAQWGWTHANAGIAGCFIIMAVRIAAVVFNLRTKPVDEQLKVPHLG